MKTLALVRRFLPLFRLLADSSLPPVFLGLDVSDAQAQGSARALFLHETRGEFPSWRGESYSAYLIDQDGVRRFTTSTPRSS